MATTARQLDVLQALNAHQSRNGYSPSVRELGAALGLSSPATVETHLRALAVQELVEWEPGQPRTLRVTLLGQSTLTQKQKQTRALARRFSW